MEIGKAPSSISSRKTIRFMRAATVPMSLRFLLRGQGRYLSERGFDVSLVSADGPELESVLEFEGCQHFLIPMSRKISPISDFVCLVKFVSLLLRIKPHIVHTHTPKAGFLGMLAGWICRTPVRIHTLAGWRLLNESRFRSYLIYAIEKITFWTAHEVWPNSVSLESYITEIGFAKPKKLHVIGYGSSNGIDLDEFCPSTLDPKRIAKVKSQIDYDERSIYLLCVGRIVVEKGIEELVRAFSQLKDNFSDVKLILVGPKEDDIDPISDAIRDTIDNDGDILEIGFSYDVKYFLSLATLLVHASHREGFPNVPLQAGAMKCPIVCSDIDGNADIVEHEKTGLTFSVRNERDLYMTLCKALNNLESMKEMAGELRTKIEHRFSREFVHDCMYARYNELAASRLR